MRRPFTNNRRPTTSMIRPIIGIVRPIICIRRPTISIRKPCISITRPRAMGQWVNRAKRAPTPKLYTANVHTDNDISNIVRQLKKSMV